MEKLTKEKLHRIFDCDTETGIFRYKIKTAQRVHVGDIAGWAYKPKRSKTAYWFMSINRKRYRAHTLVWLYVHGEYRKDLDHEDGNGLNNSISNLRIATRSIQIHSREHTNKTGLPKGVYKQTKSRGYFAIITVDKQRKYLGNFLSPEEASEAYKQSAFREYKEYARVS